MAAHECTRCGACCVAPDISSLGKALGVRCPNLTEENLCRVYDDRPAVCRSYGADQLCEDIAAPTLEERVEKYLKVFGLGVERGAAKAT
ncbi:MAG: YkgJ family cysteine cluster protein [Myxococcaceae bacterium]|nr:YkgJ family cysteine cluster protein [Myxococcaceae bacterium]